MNIFPFFLSLVFVVRDRSNELETIFTEATEFFSSLVKDYELIIVDNAFQDESFSLLKKLTGENGISNPQVYALTKEVDTEDINFLREMLNKAIEGVDVVFASVARQTDCIY